MDASGVAPGWINPGGENPSARIPSAAVIRLERNNDWVEINNFKLKCFRDIS